MSKFTFGFLCFILVSGHVHYCAELPTVFGCSSAHAGFTVQQFMQAAIDDALAKDTWVDQLGCLEPFPLFEPSPLPADAAIYNSLVNLTSLLFFSGESITGPIPSELGLLTKLKALVLTSRELTSTIPREVVVGLRNISSILLSGPVRGTVPSEINKMTSLDNIGLGNTLLHGRILDHLSSLPALSQINIVNSSFSGTIPSGLSPSIKTVSLSTNRFSGSIPSDFFTNMERFNISQNRFSGTIPTDIAKMDNDTFICIIGENRFTGTMPAHKCQSDIVASFVFPTQSPTHSPTAAPTGPTTLSPSGSPIIQTKTPTGTDRAVFTLISSSEILFIMIAIGGILLALVTAYVIINENYKSIMRLNLTAGTQFQENPGRSEAMLAAELSI